MVPQPAEQHQTGAVGQPVGAVIGEYRQRLAFRWENDALIDLGDLDVLRPSPEHATEALAINEKGVVVGVSASTAFLYRDGEMLSLGEPCSDALTPHAPGRTPRP